jgi:hypothetical protein
MTIIFEDGPGALQQSAIEPKGERSMYLGGGLGLVLLILVIFLVLR